MNLKYISMSLIMLLAACNKDPRPTIAEGEKDPGDQNTSVSIDPSQKHQLIESFAASDCWFGHYVGTYWSDTEKQSIAKLLFSSSINNGRPEGIGLSGWRFNLGGGTMQQGDRSDITDVSRRAESFLEPDGRINWDRQAGQRYFLQQAKSLGCEQFVMFSNTPPVNYTINGKGYSQMGASANLKSEHYSSFASYIATVLEHFQGQGISFNYVSPVNEPQYNWGEAGQEGSGWQNSEIKKLSQSIDQALSAKNLNTKIMLSEAAAWNYTYETDGDAGRKNVINDLFNPSSANYVGGLTHVAPIIAGHSYWTDKNWSSLLSSRSNVQKAAASRQLKVYQTEWSMLGDQYDLSEFAGFEKATYMDIALYMTKVIHHDLVNANAVSWSYWTAMATERWGHKNRFLLIRLMPAGGDAGNLTQSGSHLATKTLWALGNYSLFIRPGYSRVELGLTGSNKELFGSAYLSADGKKLVAVYSNLSNENFDAKAAIKNAEVLNVKAYTTSESQDLSERSIQDGDAAIIVSPRSVATVVYTLK